MSRPSFRRASVRVAALAAPVALLGVAAVSLQGSDEPAPNLGVNAAAITAVDHQRVALTPTALRRGLKQQQRHGKTRDPQTPGVDERPKKPKFRAKQVAVQFDASASAAVRAELRAKYGVAQHEEVIPGVERWTVDRGTEADTVEKLERESDIAIAARNPVMELASTPNDSRYAEQWYLNASTDRDIDAPEAWDASDATAATPVTVAVVDTGVQYDHPDLADSMWKNRGEYGPDGDGGRKENNGVDDDHNGATDDVFGTLIDEPTLPPTDQQSHGTHVAGIIAAQRNNAIGVAGVSKQARIMAVRTFDQRTSDELRVLAGFQYAVSKGASIINASLGYSGATPLLDAFIQAHPEVLVVAGAGNEGSAVGSGTLSFSPCVTPADNVICVGATNAADDLPTNWNGGGSNWGPAVDISAPGDGILSTVPGSSYDFKSGTSMATPVVTGAAAVLRSLYPSLTPAQVKDRLMRTADPLPNINASTAGRLNLAAAIADTTASAPGSSSPTATVSVVSNTLRYQAASGGRNAVLVEGSGGTYDVTDRLTKLTPGAGCAALTSITVRCSGATKTAIYTDDLDDSIRVKATLPATIDSGDGLSQIVTSDANDIIQGGPDADEIHTYGGNDLVVAAEGDDFVIAGTGDNVVQGNAGDDALGALGVGANTFEGGDGNDRITPAEGDDLVIAGNGDDAVNPSAGANRIYGGDGNDRLVGSTSDTASPTNSSTRDIVDGGSGSDTLLGNVEPGTYIGGPGIDTMSYLGSFVPVVAELGTTTGNGANGLDAIGADVEALVGSKYNDVLKGSANADLVSGGPGDDQVNGLGGDDFLVEDSDVDVFSGEFGDDTLSGGNGLDIVDYSRPVITAAGQNTGAAITATLDGTRNDGATGRSENDLISNDVEGVYGGPFADTLTAGNSTGATLKGGGGADTLTGGSQNDSILAQDETADTVTCGGGADWLRKDSADAGNADCETTSAVPSIRITGGLVEGESTNETKPAIEFSTPGAPSTTTCRVYLTSVGISGTEYSCDSGWRPPAALAEGDYTFLVAAKYPTSGTAYATREFTVDTTAPNTTIASGSSGTIATESAMFALTGSEPGVRYECSLDTGGFKPCENPVTFSDLADGSHNVAFRAIDPASNVDPSPETRTFSVLVPGPQTSITASPASPTPSASASFSFTSNPAGASFECKLDTGAWASCSSPKTYSSLSAASHTFSVRGTSAGETDPTPATHSWTVNPTIAPMVEIDGDIEREVNTSQPVLAFTADQSGVTFECAHGSNTGASNWVTCSSPWTSPAKTDGQLVVYKVRARNAAAVTGPPAMVQVKVDLTAPETTIDSGPVAGSNHDDVEARFTFTGADTVSIGGFECKLDSAAWIPCTSPYTWSSLPLGARTFQVRAVDGAGTPDASPASRSFTAVTPLAPIADWVDLSKDTGARISDPSPTLRFESVLRRAASFECAYGPNTGASNWAPCTSPWTVPQQTDGTVVFKVRAIGATGLIGSSAYVLYYVDTVAPDTSITSGPADGVVTGERNASYVFTAPGESSPTYQCKLDGAVWSACTSPYALTGLTDGAHTVQVRGKDEAGNFDPTPAMRTLTVEPGAALSVTTPASLSATTALTGSPASLDWVHWRNASASTLDRRNVSPTRLSTWTKLGSATVTTPASPSTTFSWTDAIGPASDSSNLGVATGEANGRGFSFTSTAALTETRTLRVYVGVKGGTSASTSGQLKLSYPADATVTPVYSSTVTASAGTTVDRSFDIRFRSRLTTDSLKVDWTQTAGGTSTGTAVVLYGATVR